MPDTPEPGAEGTGENQGHGEPKGIMVSLAVILIGILIVMVVFMNLGGQGATAASAITETVWSLDSFGNPDGSVTPAEPGTTINASFSLDGTLAGYGGCSRYSGRYMVQSTRMVISRVTAPPPACQDRNLTVQQERYYAALENADQLRVHDRVLTLFGTDGKTLLVFSPFRPA